MPKTPLEKMFLKTEYSVALLHVPQELQTDLRTNNKTNEKLESTYNFILAFYSKKEELEKEVTKLKQSLEKNGLLWIAYPKGKALNTDLNRDILHALLARYDLIGVSLISLNETWSAMRFRN